MRIPHPTSLRVIHEVKKDVHPTPPTSIRLDLARIKYSFRLISKRELGFLLAWLL